MQTDTPPERSFTRRKPGNLKTWRTGKHPTSRFRNQHDERSRSETEFAKGVVLLVRYQRRKATQTHHPHLDEIKTEAVIELHHGMKAQGYAAATANRIVILLRYMFNLGKKWKVSGAETNPTHGVDLFEVNNAKERFLTQAEALRLFEVIKSSENTQLQYIVPLLLLLGCRKRELLDAQWQDFDLDRRSWRIPMTKNGRPRHVPLSETVLQILAQLPRWEGCPYVVPNPKTLKPYVQIFYSWDTARKQAGMPELRMHDLRHSAASFLINSNHSLYVVQKLLGHTQIKTTARYSHLAPETMLNAADAMANAAGLGVPVRLRQSRLCRL